MYTVGQAARATGKSKSTISAAVKSGKISATRNEDGSWSIDPAELHRVFPAKGTANGTGEPELDDSEPSDFLFENGRLKAELEQMRERLAASDLERQRERQQLSDQIDDLRRRLDAEAEERRRLTAILTPPRPAEPPPVQVRGFRAWFSRRNRSV
jgi:hypothetical protein